MVYLCAISTSLLKEIRTDTTLKDCVNKTFASIYISDIVNQLVSDEEKITFWVNVYNASVTEFLRAKPESYTNKASFFRSKNIHFKDLALSLDDIEHGILRRGIWGYSLGYLPSPILKWRFSKD